MKNLQSIEEGKWVELLPFTFTKEEMGLLVSKNPEDIEAKETLLAKIETKTKKAATKTDAAVAKAKYEEVKPTLKEEDTYELITVDVFIDKTVLGILNCRVNGEHKQIRF